MKSLPSGALGAVLSAAASLLPQLSAQGLQDGTADLTPHPHQHSSVFRDIELADAPPQAAQWKLPSGIDVARFASIPFGDGEPLAIALDHNLQNPRIWVDTDFDGDLAEERAQTFHSSDGKRECDTTVVARYLDEPKPSPLTLRLRYEASSPSAEPTLELATVTEFVGKVVLGQRERDVVLVDGNDDGRFDDQESDGVFVDLNGDGNLYTTSVPRGQERVVVGKPFTCGGETWTADVALASGRHVVFSRGEDATDSAATEPVKKLAPWPNTYRYIPGRSVRQPSDSFAEIVAKYNSAKTAAVRQEAVRALGGVGTDEAFDKLCAIAESSDEYQTRNGALRSLGNPACLASRGSRLLSMFKNTDTRDAPALAEALFQMGHPDRTAAYLRKLKDSEPRIVGAAAQWLAADAEDETSRNAVLAAGKSGADNTRLQAYRLGVRRLPGGPPSEYVLELAKRGSLQLQIEAVEDLTKFAHPETVALAAELTRIETLSGYQLRSLISILGRDGSASAAEALLEMLERDDLEPEIHTKITDALAPLRAPAVIEALTRGLDNKHVAVRRATARVLSRVRGPSVLPALLKRAKRERDETALAALLDALGDHGDEVAAPVLVKAAKARRKPRAQAVAIRALGRIGLTSRSVRQVILKHLHGKDWTRVALAIQAIQTAEDRELLREALRHLGHEQWQVRLSILETAEELRLRSAVEPLIERLAVESESRVRKAIGVTLFRLTNQNLRDNHQAWSLWWDENKETFEVPMLVPTLPDGEASGTTAGFFGIPVLSDRVVFVIDRSGSMSAKSGDDTRERTQLEVAIGETKTAIENLNESSKLNIVMFNDKADTWEDELKKLRTSTKEVDRFLSRQNPGGGTNIFDPLELALHMDEVDTIYLLSDGSPGSGKFVATDAILKNIAEINRVRRVVIHCVSIGIDSELLRGLADESGGRYVRR